MSEVINIKELNERIERESVFVDTLRNEMGKVIVGQSHLVDTLLIGLLSNGHILLEGVPGLAKTLAITTLAKAVDACFSRIQFTPDLLPADLIGTLIYSQKNEDFVVRKGPIFANFVLADEINRTSSKTQAALLEAMEEGNVTVEGKTYALPQPHLVIATQNPLGCVGTQSLPESQLDRFLMRLHMGYPEIDEEVAILRGKAVHNPLEDIRPVCTPEHLRELQQQAAAVYVDDRLYYYAASIAKATREHPQVTLGVSPRGTLALVQSAKAMAMLRGRNYLLPDDITQLCMDVLAHRILTKGSVNVGRILDEILHQVPAPVPDRR